jgi:hypothetical protein
MLTTHSMKGRISIESRSISCYLPWCAFCAKYHDRDCILDLIRDIVRLSFILLCSLSIRRDCWCFFLVMEQKPRWHSPRPSRTFPSSSNQGWKTGRATDSQCHPLRYPKTNTWNFVSARVSRQTPGRLGPFELDRVNSHIVSYLPASSY